MAFSAIERVREINVIQVYCIHYCLIFGLSIELEVVITLNKYGHQIYGLDSRLNSISLLNTNSLYFFYINWFKLERVQLEVDTLDQLALAATNALLVYVTTCIKRRAFFRAVHTCYLHQKFGCLLNHL